ncbi:MAG: TauD/TfdA family dioxygenase [Mycobacteriaceae bacterium]
MDAAVHEPLGVTLTGVRLQELTDEQVSGLAVLLAEHGVAVIPGQDLDDGEFAQLLHRFGAPAFATGETPVPGHPDLNIVSNVGRTTPPRSTFHVDTSYLRRPPRYTALRAVTVPAQGGETVFTNQYRAYDTLPTRLRDRLDGRTITHVVTGLELGPDDETSAEHPVFRRHPISGRTSVYMSTPARCAAVSGLAAEEADELVSELFTHCTQEDNSFRHAWSAGDVVMWDNACVLHKADHTGVVGDRVMHRGMVAGDAEDDTSDDAPGALAERTPETSPTL